MAPRSVQAATFKELDRRFDDLKQQRLYREQEWQLIADVFTPRKDFTLPMKPTELRRRRLTSSVPPIALERGMALVFAHMIDHTRPFVLANAKRGLVAAGRPTDLDPKSQDYLGGLAWSIRDRMMLPRSGFLTSTPAVCLELGAFGTAVQWVTRKRGFGPVYQRLPIRACWISEDEDGMVDTLYFRFSLPIWKAVERWPDHGVEAWRKAMGDDDPNCCKAPTTIIRAVEPRQGGEYGAVGSAKPHREVYFSLEHKAILAESGYDSFPAAVPRLNVEDGSCYGTGWAWKVLPEALVLNAVQQSMERGLELRIDPPLFLPKRMFGKALDRRAGAVNYYDSGGLGFQNANQAVQKLDIAGDVALASDYLRRLEQNVEQAFFIDWMRLRESGTMTAEEVRERRAMRIGAMSAIVPGIDRDLMGPLCDRTLSIMDAEGELARPPAQLSGVDVDWEYAGPLAIAQMRGQAEAISQLLSTAQIAAAMDPTAAHTINFDEALREVAEALAAPPGTLNSREDTAAAKAAEARAQAMARSQELMTSAAQALRDGGQGAQTLGMTGGQGTTGQGAPTAAMAA